MKETLHLLVVDDEEGMRRAVGRALARFVAVLPDMDREIAFETQAVESAEEALALLDQQVFDVILLDHKLPGMTGLDLLERVEPRGLDTVIIMITAYASIESAILATKRGAFDLLPKPFTPEDLKASIRKATRHLVVQREARRLAAERHHIRFQFLSVLSHELKAPLAAVESYLYLMRDHVMGNELTAYDESVRRSLVRLDGARKLIFDLLDLTRIESGQKARTLAPVDLVELARAAIENVATDALARGIGIELLSPSTLVLTADQSELEIVLSNLLSNAVKYNRDNGAVTVTLAEGDPGTCTMSVKDTGIGLTPEETARLFGEFVRIKNAKTRAIPGSGLGLSIVKRLAELYGGRVSVTSAPDVGSTFTVTLRKEMP